MTSAYRFDPVIIRENDVRGIYGETLKTDDAHALGWAYATVAVEAGGRRNAVAYDGRLSSPALEDALVADLSEGACMFCVSAVIEQPEVWKLGFPLISHPGISI